MGQIVSKFEENDDQVKGWIRFMISVEAIYKKGKESRIKKGTMSLVVPATDLACKCPKIKTNK